MDLQAYLAEDLGDAGDVTTEALGIDASALGRVRLGEPATVAGIEEATRLIAHVGAEPESRTFDGEPGEADEIVLTARGDADRLLEIERLLLNILGRMSGIATRTRNSLARARRANPDIVVAATRKTTPGFRDAEKRAVVLGGGDPHRRGLHDAVLIKENHLVFVDPDDAVAAARETGLRVIVEAETLAEAEAAAKAGADRVLLDNFDPETLAEVAGELRDAHPDLVLEASGGITPDNVADYAGPVDVVSLGSLTTEADWIDYSMYLEAL